MVSKNLFELEQGDVIRVLYGDFDNWVNAVFDSFAIDDFGVCIYWHAIGKTDKRTMWTIHCSNGIYHDVIGREEDFLNL